MSNEEVMDKLINKICTDLELTEELSEHFLRSFLSCVSLFDAKQHDYGPDNIAQFGDLGVLIRLNDKVQRLRTLLMSGEAPRFSDEALDDTWMDIAVYGVIGFMCHKGKWPNAYRAVQALKKQAGQLKIAQSDGSS